MWLVGVGVSSGYGCKDVYTVFTLLIRGEKIKYFSHRPRIIIILFLEIVIPRIIRDTNYYTIEMARSRTSV